MFPPESVEDALVTFTVVDARITGMTMKPWSPLAKFGDDFQPLSFGKVP